MTELMAKCADGETRVLCISTLFSDVTKYIPDITVEQMQLVDTVFRTIKKMNVEQSNLHLVAKGWNELFLILEISSKLGISSVKSAVESAIRYNLQEIVTPGDARVKFGISNNFPDAQDTALTEIFVEIFDQYVVHQKDEK